MKGQKSTIKNEQTRPITADTAAQIENAANEARELAAVILVMQQAFFDGAPDPEITADALGSVGNSLQRISAGLDDILEQIQGKLEKGDE